MIKYFLISLNPGGLLVDGSSHNKWGDCTFFLIHSTGEVKFKNKVRKHIFFGTQCHIVYTPLMTFQPLQLNCLYKYLYDCDTNA